MNKIIVGALQFDDDSIMSVSGNLQTSIVGEELCIDTFTAVVNSKQVDITPLKSMPYGTLIRYYHDNEQVGTFYFKSSERITRDTWQINGISSIGLLDKQTHTGGIYSGTTFKNVLEDIIGESSHIENTIYDQYEYIESSGNQYIDTGVCFDENTGIKFDFAYYDDTSSVLSKFYYGVRQTVSGTQNDINCYGLYQSSSSSTVVNMGSIYSGTWWVSTSALTHRIVQMNYLNDNKISSGNYPTTFSYTPATSFTYNYPLYLCCMNVDGTANYCSKMRIYECWITQGSNIIRHFIPAKNRATNTIGLYDTVNDVFYSNKGSGSFTAGSVVGEYEVQPANADIYQEVEYIETTGAQYINTNLYPTNEYGVKWEMAIDSDNIELYNASGAKTFFGNYNSTSGGSGTVSYFMSSYPSIGYLQMFNDSQRHRVAITYTDLLNRNTFLMNYKNDKIYNILGTSGTYTASSFTSESPLYLFGQQTTVTNTTIVTKPTGVKLYSMEITNGTNVVRNFKPVIRERDGKSGLFDTVNKQFYTSATSTDFLYGATTGTVYAEEQQMNQSPYQRVEYIQTMNGASALNTNYIPTSATGISIDCNIFDYKYTVAQTTTTGGTTTYYVNPTAIFPLGVRNYNLTDTSNPIYYNYYLGFNSPYVANSTTGAVTDSSNDSIFAIIGDKNVTSSLLTLPKNTIFKNRNTVNINYLNSGVFKIGNYSASLTTSSFTNSATPLQVGGIRFCNLATGAQSSNSSNDCYLRIYSMSISENATEVRHFIPVYRKADGKVGMLDTLNDIFITNFNSNSSFIAGAEVNNGTSSDIVFDYIIDDDLKSIQVYGWLPYDTKRNNLYQLLFAHNANLIKGEDGSLIFTIFRKSTTPTVKSLSDMYDGGKVDYASKPNKIELTQHQYYVDSSVDTEKLFDNTESQDEVGIVYFENPVVVSTLTTTGTIAISSSNPNYANITGIGTISGKYYKHDTAILTEKSDIDTENNVSITEATLVSPNNSETVMEKLTSYYFNYNKVTGSMIFDMDRCGNYIQFVNPYNETNEGFIKNLKYNGSSNIKTEYEIITNFEPSGSATTYNHCEVLTADGTFTVPADTTELKVILIGGGTGGYSGLAGKQGSNGYEGEEISTWYEEYPGGGDGGEGGDAGAGGKVNIVKITTTAGTTFSYTIGTGGAGGVATNSTSTHNAGSAGTASTFGTYSSDNGSTKTYTDLSTGNTYGGTGSTSGNKGGTGAFFTAQENGSTVVWTNGGTVNGAYGGGLKDSTEYNYYTYAGNLYIHYFATGGYGGGGAQGNLSYSTANGSAPTLVYGYNYRGGNGGVGLFPTQPAKETVRGKGGVGGHGGGGGGAGGRGGYRYTDTTTEDEWHYTYTCGYGGAGGGGGAGGDGADGCVIVYY